MSKLWYLVAVLATAATIPMYRAILSAARPAPAGVVASEAPVAQVAISPRGGSVVCVGGTWYTRSSGRVDAVLVGGKPARCRSVR